MAPSTREDTPTGVSWLDTPTSHGIAASRHSSNNDLVSPGDAKMMYIQSALFAESGNHPFQNDFPIKELGVKISNTSLQKRVEISIF